MDASELRKKTCCFTGHRDLPADKTVEITLRTAYMIRKLIIEKDVRFFGVGGAIGYDTLVAEVLFQMKASEFPHIKVILVYPFDGFTSRWTPPQQAVYERMLPQYDKVVPVCEIAGRDAYLTRDRYLVDGSAYCVAYCTRERGGTAYTVSYAKEQGLEIYYIF